MSSSKRIGNDGEKKVADILSRLPSSNFKLYNNVMLKTKSGTTQIDHILVTDRGIFIIETKAIKGMIFGDAHSKYWTQCLYGKGKSIMKHSFYNPYWQNRGHIKNLIYHLKTTWVCGVVCFTSDNVDLSHVDCSCITKLNCLYNVICRIYQNSPPADYNLYEMCKRLESVNIQSTYYDRKHVDYVKSLSER